MPAAKVIGTCPECERAGADLLPVYDPQDAPYLTAAEREERWCADCLDADRAHKDEMRAR